MLASPLHNLNGAAGGVGLYLPKQCNSAFRKGSYFRQRRPRRGLPPQVIRFQVSLFEPNRIYFAGDEISGEVRIVLSQSLPIQGIIIRIVGEAYVNVSEDPRPQTNRRRLRNLKSTLRNKKILPTSISEQVEMNGKPNGTHFSNFGSSPSGNWETVTATTTTLTNPKSAANSTPQQHQQQEQKEQIDLTASAITSGQSKTISFKDQENSKKKFCSHEKYFEHRAYVFGHKYSSARETMWEGSHCFSFQYNLPSKLPASFHGKFGYIRYFCEASLERHNQPTIQRRAFFNVSNIMDLNTDTKADQGVSKGKKTNSWCFCCVSGTIIVSAKIRKRGYVPGETIPIQAHILNISNKMIAKSSAKIIQIATYFSSKAFRKHVDETLVCEKEDGAVPPGDSVFWNEQGPRVPPLPPSSTMIDCKLITLDYRLEFVLDITGDAEPLVLRMPLRIGTVPLEKTFKRLDSVDFDTDRMYTAFRTEIPIPIALKYPNLPATYSLKCVKGEQHVNRYYYRQIPRSMSLGINLRVPDAPPRAPLTDENQTYAPRYISYKEHSDNMECLLEEDNDFIRKFRRQSHYQPQAPPEHLVIQVSPVRTTHTTSADSTSRLSICGSPTSLKSFRSVTSKTSVPSIRLDLINRLSSRSLFDSDATLRYRQSSGSILTTADSLVSDQSAEWDDKKNK